jgi:hypothetical protein
MTHRDGYALPLTLAAIAVIALVAAIAAREVRSATASITALSDQTRNQAELISAEQTLIYLALTEPMGMRGVEVGGVGGSLFLREIQTAPPGEIIPANGAPRRFGAEGAIIRLYDDQSFLNISTTNEAALSRTLAAYGVARSQHRRLSATLNDFQDADDRRRLGGAEAADYRDRPPPPNRRLRDALEACAVLGWEQIEACEDRGRLLLTARARNTTKIPPQLVSSPPAWPSRGRGRGH